jgi:hypothetical protein
MKDTYQTIVSCVYDENKSNTKFSLLEKTCFLNGTKNVFPVFKIENKNNVIELPLTIENLKTFENMFMVASNKSEFFISDEMKIIKNRLK